MKKITYPGKIRVYEKKCGFLTFFSSLEEADVQLYRAEEKEAILKEGEEAGEYLYYLVDGKAKVFSTLPNGNRFLLDFLWKPCFIGELELLGVRSDTMAIQAQTECYLLAVPLRKYRETLMQDACFLRHLSLFLAEKEEMRMQKLADMHAYSVPSRLAQFILLASSNGRYLERNTDASAYLGISYRHLTQNLAELVKSGLLCKEDGGYRIADLDGMNELADKKK